MGVWREMGKMLMRPFGKTYYRLTKSRRKKT
jgi:hypothetical protein